MQKLTKRILTLCLSAAVSFTAFAQNNMGVGTLTPHPSSVLDLTSTDKGVLIPRLTTTQRVAISNPATGLLVYDLTTSGFWYFDGTIWVQAMGTQGPTGPPGPAGANGPTGFLANGTAPGNTTYWDGSQWVLNSNNIYNNGAGVGIGTLGATDASAKLEVASTTQGFLLPRMTTVERNAIASPAQSLIIFNTTTNCLEMYVSGNWISISCGCSSPGTPSGISGLASVCASQAGVSYSISPVSGATSYTWTVPSGASVVSGQGTTSVSVNFGNSAGTVSVTASNNCGTSAANTLTISLTSAPATPGSISGLTTVNANQTGVTYSISAVSGATSYTWTVPSGASVTSGQGTTSVTVNFATSAGNVCVTASNSCGTSAASCLGITLLNCYTAGSTTFGFTGGAQTWTVPCGVTSITVDAAGAGSNIGVGSWANYGNNNPGLGARTQTTLTVTPGQSLYFYVGGQPAPGYLGGYNGGGDGGTGYSPGEEGGGGGGASDIRSAGNTFNDRLVVAAGAGGAGADCQTGGNHGGNGGNPNGYIGSTCEVGITGGDGATQSGGGAGGVDNLYFAWPAGNAGVFGIGGTAGTTTLGGGGGGGYYGGGGGCFSGGGGGSSFADPGFSSGTTYTAGYNAASGQIIINW